MCVFTQRSGQEFLKQLTLCLLGVFLVSACIVQNGDFRIRDTSISRMEILASSTTPLLSCESDNNDQFSKHQDLRLLDSLKFIFRKSHISNSVAVHACIKSHQGAKYSMYSIIEQDHACCSTASEGRVVQVKSICKGLYHSWILAE